MLKLHLLESRILFAQVGDVARGHFAGRVPDQPFLPGLEKLLAPAVVEIWVQAFAMAQRRDAFLAPSASGYEDSATDSRLRQGIHCPVDWLGIPAV